MTWYGQPIGSDLVYWLGWAYIMGMVTGAILFAFVVRVLSLWWPVLWRNRTPTL